MNVLTKQNEAKAFLKWAGGKSQLIPQIGHFLPKDLTVTGKIRNYIEPFLGGGAIFFWLSSIYDFENIYLFELNKEVAHCYQTIKTRVNSLIDELEVLQNKYLSKSDVKREEFFYSMREEFNELALEENNKIRKSALLIFLNKTCYNGLYRVNSKNIFNVPFGRYKNPLICNKYNLLAVNEMLSRAEVIHGDFSQCLAYADKKTFVYLDPPYRPLSQTSSFNSYSSQVFNDDEQIRLSKTVYNLNKKGSSVMLSNSDPKNSNPNDNFFDDLYQDYNIERVKAKRMINSNSSHRGDVNEILVMNY